MQTIMVSSTCLSTSPSKALANVPHTNVITSHISTSCAAMNDLSRGEETSSAHNDLGGGPSRALLSPNDSNIAPSLPFSSSSSGGRNEPVESDERGEESVTDNTAVPDPLPCADRTSGAERCGQGPVGSKDKEVVCVRIIPSDTGESCSSLDVLSKPRLGSDPYDNCQHQRDNLQAEYAHDDHTLGATGGVHDDHTLGAVGGVGVTPPDTPPPYIPPDPLLNYSQFFNYKVSILGPSARRFLSIHLNQEIEGLSSENYTKNWKGLAELMGMDAYYIESLDRLRDPADEVLKEWGTGKAATIGQLLTYLKYMDRYDILDDHTFLHKIQESVYAERKREDKHKQELEDEKKRKAQRKPTERQLITADDAESGKIVHYDAFVCFDEEDSDFVMEMLEELEGHDKLKLCLSARDLLAAQDEKVVTAEMVKNRCNKTIVILSPAFISEDSVMGQFAMRIAQSVNPARQSRLIPLMQEDCVIPTSLHHLTPVDFTRCLQRDWQWRKVAKSLKSDEELLQLAEEEVMREIDKENHALSQITLDLGPPEVDIRASIREKQLEKLKIKAMEGTVGSETVKVISESSPPLEDTPTTGKPKEKKKGPSKSVLFSFSKKKDKKKGGNMKETENGANLSTPKDEGKERKDKETEGDSSDAVNLKISSKTVKEEKKKDKKKGGSMKETEKDEKHGRKDKGTEGDSSGAVNVRKLSDKLLGQTEDKKMAKEDKDSHGVTLQKLKDMEEKHEKEMSRGASLEGTESDESSQGIPESSASMGEMSPTSQNKEKKKKQKLAIKKWFSTRKSKSDKTESSSDGCP